MFPPVRGSPLIRFFLLTLSLAIVGAGLAWLTFSKKPGKPAAVTPAGNDQAVSTLAVPYQLQLSGEAAQIGLDTGIAKASSKRGTLRLDPGNPYVSISVQWKNPPSAEEQRFAKLILEPAGKPTFTHVFDSTGDIDDLLELPLSP